MKLLNINSNYFNSSLYRLMDEEFIKSGVEVNTYVPLHKKSNIREECRFKIPEYVNKSICLRRYDRLIFHLKHYKIKKDIMKNYNLNEFDMIYAHTLFSNGYIALQIFKKTRTPYNVMIYGSDINVFFKYMYHLRSLGLEILENARNIFVSCNGHKEILLEKYIPENKNKYIRDKIKVVPFGIEEFWINNKNKPKLLKKTKKIRLLTVASIERNKNQLTVLKACEKLIEQGYDIEYTIIGKVVDKEVFDKLNKEFVNYISRKDKEELINVYRNNDIFIMPSISESFGLVYPEAMSQGLPVIYTKNQGFDKHFIDGDIGYSVNPLNVYEIIDKIKLIYNNYDEISQNCIEKVEKFKWEKIMDIYSKIMNHK